MDASRWFRSGLVGPAVCLVLLPAAAAAERRQSGNVVFDLPPNWEAAELEVGPDDLPLTVLRHEDWIDVDSVSIHLPRGQAFSGPEAAIGAWGDDWLFRHLDTDDDEHYETTAWQEVDGAGPVRVFIGGGKVAGMDGRGLRAIGAILTLVGGRAELAFVDVRTRDLDDPAVGLRASMNALLETVSGFAYLSAGASPLIGPPKPGPLDGVWWGTSLDLQLQLDGSLGTTMRHETYVFSSDGRFFEGIPPGGVAALADPETRLRYTHDSGTYELRGGEVVLRYASGETETIEKKGDVLDAGLVQLGRVRLLPDGATFAATRSSLSYTPLAAGIGESAGVSSSSEMTFRPDGAFDREGFVSASGNYASAGFVVSSDSADRGTYTVRGGEAELRYDDGRVVRWSCFVSEGEDSEVLWLAGTPADLAPGFRLPASRPKDSAVAGRAGPAANPLARGADPAGAAVNPLARRDAPSNPLARPEAPRNPLSR